MIKQVLSIAGSDSGGGAGIQADILTLASIGCHPLPVITGITVQDSARVEALLTMDAKWVDDQARCVLEDMPIAAIKLGLLCSVEIIAVIAEIVSDYPDVPLICPAKYRPSIFFVSSVCWIWVGGA